MIIKTKQEIERRKQVLLMSADTLKFVFNDSVNLDYICNSKGIKFETSKTNLNYCVERGAIMNEINKYNEIINDAEKRLYLLKQIVAEYKQ